MIVQSRKSIERFFASTAFAVVGVSANRRKFGNAVYRAMKERGLTVYPIHPTLHEVEGDRCYASVLELPEGVDSVITVIKPRTTRQVMYECARKKISNVWMQPGSDSDEAAEFGSVSGMNVIRGQCVLMFLEPVTSIHSVHRWMKRVVRMYPA
jgi:predicted CoA-binding protein